MSRSTRVLFGTVVGLVGLVGLLTWRLLATEGVWSSGPQISVRFVSHPAGATLVSADSRRVFGATPVTLSYSEPTNWQTCVPFEGFRARWPDGTQLAVRSVELCPDGGPDQEIQIQAPRVPRRTGAAQAKSAPKPLPEEQEVASSTGTVELGEPSALAAPAVRSPSPAGPAPLPTYIGPRVNTASPRSPSLARAGNPGRLAVQIVARASNESQYSFVVPGYVSTNSNAYADCHGTTFGSLSGSRSGLLTGSQTGSTFTGTYSEQSSGTYTGHMRVNCSGTSYSKTTIRPPEDVSYSVTGATLSLRLPDGRVAVVNCDSKFDWANWQYRRSCRVPSADRLEAEFRGENAKLSWQVGVYGEKTQSETYKLIEIVEPSR